MNRINPFLQRYFRASHDRSGADGKLRPAVFARIKLAAANSPHQIVPATSAGYAVWPTTAFQISAGEGLVGNALEKVHHVRIGIEFTKVRFTGEKLSNSGV